MLVISIDIGEKNLGWTIAKVSDEIQTKKIPLSSFEFSSGVFDFTSLVKDNVVLSRVLALKRFFEIKLGDEQVWGAVIERQVFRNEIAMELMYSVVSFLSMKTDNIIIFDPKLKFSKIGQQYSTVNKAHKKQSIENMKRMISDESRNSSFKTLSEKLDSEKARKQKQDDIADSFNQLIVQLTIWDKLDEGLDFIKDIYNGK